VNGQKILRPKRPQVVTVDGADVGPVGVVVDPVNNPQETREPLLECTTNGRLMNDGIPVSTQPVKYASPFALVA
jgi:hypothetical protein